MIYGEGFLSSLVSAGECSLTSLCLNTADKYVE